jgi:hypothetical protein
MGTEFMEFMEFMAREAVMAFATSQGPVRHTQDDDSGWQ